MIHHPVFSSLTQEEFETAIKYFEKKSFKPDEFIVKENENSDMAFLLLEGEVEVIKLTIYKDDYVIETIKAPSKNFFGEVNLIDKGAVTSTIKTVTDTVILSITHERFKTLTYSHPNIGVKMLWVIAEDLARHLRKADQDIITLFNAFIEMVEND